MRSVRLFAAAVLLSAIAVPVLADDGHPKAPQPSAPRPIADVVSAGGGTVSGAVQAVGPSGFTVSDGRDSLIVAARGLSMDGLRVGAPITVAGRMHHGTFRPVQIIREDGTSVSRNDRHDGGRDRRRHDDGHNDD
ncbi:hypothetical protein [Azospirillum griseum]|uniref:DUF5666 domain-containing protein n=1 Tax=Azospirillum griseum TaxID=2496639 RepID=A0A3S0I1A7_9PROT|nr:hypothetical protein [Azospirillum griseum]RTR21002.1 hypothetical protein EJ903_09650 [Azospirillum griseum]